MTTNDIDAIEARANAATPGEWIYDSDNTGLCFGPHIGLLNSRGVSIPIHHRTDEDAAQSYATAAFIAAARQDVPALCAEVRELRAVLERARALLKLTEYVYDVKFEQYYCESCGQGKGYGHQKDCELAAALGEGGRP